jgi:protoporphyrinogen oxidase
MVAHGGGKTALIIGAGPAGLTAAWELLERTGITPVVLEGDPVVGGISRTLEHNGNRIDIGGHRFFSKSDRVMEWWLRHLPIGAEEGKAVGPDDEPVMLVRGRLSRILYRGKFFKYPIALELDTLAKIGWLETAAIGLAFVRAKLFPRKPEASLEDFFINRFGRRLYRTFFKDYTEKVWGVPCRDIPAEWGAQRVKGLSIAAVIAHAVRKALGGGGALAQKSVETSLIDRFLYPKRGPGQLWETVADRVVARGGDLRLGQRVVAVRHAEGRVTAVIAEDRATGERRDIPGDLFASTMPVRDLILALDPPAPAPVRAVAEKLLYRDFITVGVLLDRVSVAGRSADGPALAGLLPDNWIYVQEPFVKVGRIQVFNNWSPYLVADPRQVWLGLEYFANEGDALWSLSDDELADLGKRELEQLGFARAADCRDAMVARMPKAYPAYFGEGYARFAELRAYLDGFGNLYLLGRNGMHRYNNQDHSMLTAMLMVDNIVAGRADKANLWTVNTEQDYHEEKKS